MVGFLERLRFAWRRLPLATYHLAAMTYRTTLSIAMALWLFRFLTALYAFPLAIVASVICLINATWPWLHGWQQWRQGKQEWQRVSKYHRRIITGTLLVSLITFFIFQQTVRVQGEGVVEVVNAATVFIPSAGGQVDSVLVQVGDHVSRGDVLATLNNAELELKILQLQHRVDQLQTQHANLLKRALTEPQLLEQKSTVQAAHQAALKQLELAIEEQAALRLIAPCDGVILPPDGDQARLPDPSMRGTFVSGGSLWCRVGDPQQRVARVLIDRDERRHIGTGSKVQWFLPPPPSPPPSVRFSTY